MSFTKQTQKMQHLFEIPLRKELHNQLRKIRDCDIYIDVGACVGTSSLLLEKGTCYAFEFDPEALIELKNNIALNPTKKVVVVESPVSNEEVGYELKRKDRLGDTYLIKNCCSTQKTVTLDNYFKNLKNIKVIKIDAEGQDYNVLLGARRTLKKLHPWIIVEAWSKELDRLITCFLEQLGYTTRHVGINVVGEYTPSNRRLEITTLNKCSVSCRYCPQEVYQHAYTGISKLTLENFKKALNNVPKTVIIEFAGFCEPFLNPECIDMVEYADNQGYQVILDTTLTGLTSEDIQRLSKIDFLAFSLHLPDNQKNTNIPTQSLIYQKALVTCLEAMRVDSFISMNDNFESNLRAGNCKDSKPKRRQGFYLCKKLSNPAPVLLPNGDIVLCCMDFGLKHNLGNLFITHYDVIVNSPEFLKVKQNRFQISGNILCRSCTLSEHPIKFFAKIMLNKIRCIMK
jgi:FkbM family methyltransferase